MNAAKQVYEFCKRMIKDKSLTMIHYYSDKKGDNVLNVGYPRKICKVKRHPQYKNTLIMTYLVHGETSEYEIVLKSYSVKSDDAIVVTDRDLDYYDHYDSVKHNTYILLTGSSDY